MDVERLKELLEKAAIEPEGASARVLAEQDYALGELEFDVFNLARSVIALTEDLAARDKAHECDAQIAADLIAGEQAKRYEVEAERGKLIAALKDAQEYAEGLELQLAEANKAFATLAQATQETSNATQEEKQNG